MRSKRLTSAEVVELLASKSGTTVEQAKALLQAQAEMAYARATEGFPIPGIGVFRMIEQPGRKMIMPLGSRAGEEITVPTKRRLTFRVSRIAEEMVLRPPQPLPDLFKHIAGTDFRCSSDATLVSDPSEFIEDLGTSLTLLKDNTLASLVVHRLPDLWVPSGRIVAADLLTGGGKPFSRSIPFGRYPLALAVARIGTDERVAFAILRFSREHVAKWEMAVTEGQNAATLKNNEILGYGVDSGAGSFCDASAQQLFSDVNETDIGFFDQVTTEMKKSYKNTRNWVHIESPSGSLAAFSSGFGDGYYASYFGLDVSGNAVALVTDFGIVGWRKN